VTAALLLAAVGLRAAAGSALHGGGANGGLVFALGSLFGIGTLIAATKYRTHTRTTEVHTTALDRLRTATVAVMFAAAVLVPFTLIVLHKNNDSGMDAFPYTVPTDGGASRSAAYPAPPVPQPSKAHGGLHIDFGVLLLILVIIAMAVALAAAVVLALSLIRNTPPQGAISSAAPAPESGIEDEALAEALAAGRSALDGDDARAAIIACYAAMEDSLADAGVARETADSPTDLLRRATARDAVDRSAAAALTDLFREARYSTHPMHDGHLAAARGALDTITASITEALARRAEQEQAEAEANAASPARSTAAGRPANPARAQ
jgi:hypothetical protein